MMEAWLLAFYILITGAVPGFLSSWLGIGGCFLRIPMLMALLGLPIKYAYGVNMAVISLTTFPGVLTHHKMGHIYKKGAIVASVTAGAGVLVGSMVAIYLPVSILKVIFGMACFFIGIYMMYQAIKTKGITPPRVTVHQVRSLPYGWQLGSLMFAAGIATGLCGFGGGIYYVPVLTASGYPMHIAIGTSSLAMIPTAGVGAVNLGLHGYMDLLCFAGIGLVTLVFTWIGARATKSVKAWILRAVFGGLIGAIGIGVAIGLI